jgi:PAS domain S-box-containing protein
MGTIKKFQHPWLHLLWPRQFARQVVLLTSIAIILSNAIFTTYQIAEVSKFQYDNSKAMLGAIAENISLGITHPLIVQDYAAIEQLLLRAAIFPGIRSISIADPSGRIVSSVQHEPGKPVEPVFTSTTLSLPAPESSRYKWSYGTSEHGHPLALGLDATSLSLWQPIENGALGWLHINFSVAQVRGDGLHLITDSILFALIGIIAFALILSRSLKPTLHALGAATDFARSLKSVHGQQIPIFFGSTEIEHLGRVLNETSQRLYTQDTEIKNANAFLANVLNASSEVSIIATNLDGIITVFNSGAERLLGYTASEMVNAQTPAIFHLADEVQRRAEALSVELGYPIQGFTTFHAIADLKGSEIREWTYVRKSGEHIPVSLAITTMRDDSGKISGYLGIAHDISVHKRNDKMKSEFVSTVSHELRTPLTAIAGALGLISGGALGKIPETAMQMISIAHKNSQRLTYLINDLLDMEKLIAGKAHFHMKQQALMPLIEQSIEGILTYGADRRIKLALSRTAADAHIWVDSQRLIQVLSNLLSNAIKYSPDEGTVEIAAQAQDESVRISVSDNGPGIPAEFRSHIFEKFSQADSSDTRQKGGTGLGLAITRELVERMGGTIGFDSIEGKGSTFYVNFPLGPTQRTNLETAMDKSNLSRSEPLD